MTDSEKQPQTEALNESDLETQTKQDPESTQANSDAEDENELQAAQTKANELWDQLLRTKAEMENIQKRNKKDVEDAHKYALERFVNELLPVRDSMELGLQAAMDSVDVDKLKEGMELTLKMLVACLDKFGIEVIDPKKGDKLNPELHQAMSLQESDEIAPNSVLMVVQKGYSLNGRLVRPAMVIVAKPVSTPDPETSGGTQIDEQA